MSADRQFDMECYSRGTLIALEGEVLRLRTALAVAGTALECGLPSKCARIIREALAAPRPTVEADPVAALVAAALSYQEAVDDTRIDNDELTRRKVELGRAVRAYQKARG